jgi:catalase
LVTGTFTPSAGGALISVAPHLQDAPVPLTVRFSNFSGVPTTPDTDGLASPRGMALRFHLPDGSTTDIVSHSFNGFPCATADEFRALFVALGTSGAGGASPTPLDRFLSTHPIAKAFLGGQKPPPVSYATLSYFGVNSFKFTDALGHFTYGRYQIEPALGERFLAKEQIPAMATDYLRDDLLERVEHGPVSFKLLLQLSEEGEIIDDPSVAWPDTREKIELGTIDLTKTVDEALTAERALVFSPAKLPAGIEPADPMVRVRDAAYGVSYERRRL